MRDLELEKAITEIEELTDGMIACPAPDKKYYRMRAAYQLSKKLGRPLTDEEMAQFEIKNVFIPKKEATKDSKMVG